MACHIGGEFHRLLERVAYLVQTGVVACQDRLIAFVAASPFGQDGEEVTAVFPGIAFEKQPHGGGDGYLYPCARLAAMVDNIFSPNIVVREVCQVDERHTAGHKAEEGKGRASAGAGCLPRAASGRVR